jgi:hypothetical protein
MRLVRTVTLCCWLFSAGVVTCVSAQTTAIPSPVSLHPNLSVGIHLVLNSEWKNSQAVPSLVDANGFFFPRADRAALAQEYGVGMLAERADVTYRDVITREGLQSMRRPVE